MEHWNIWKVLFLSTIGVIGLIVLVMFLWLHSLTTGNTLNKTVPVESIGGVEFTVTTSKGDINRWIQKEIEEVGGENISILLGTDVHFQMELNVFGFQVPLDMLFTPHVTNEGNLELHQNSFTIGNLAVPSERVFQLIKQTGELPEWITVYPSESMFYLNLYTGVSEEFNIKVNKFDLIHDDIEMKVIIP